MKPKKIFLQAPGGLGSALEADSSLTRDCAGTAGSNRWHLSLPELCWPAQAALLLRERQHRQASSVTVEV